MRKIALIGVLSITFLISLAVAVQAQTAIEFEKEIDLGNIYSDVGIIHDGYYYIVSGYGDINISKVDIENGNLVENYSLKISVEEVSTATFGDGYFWIIAFNWTEESEEYLVLKYTENFDLVSTIKLKLGNGYPWVSGATYNEGRLWILFSNETKYYIAIVSSDGEILIRYNITNLINGDEVYAVDVEYIENKLTILLNNGTIIDLDGHLVLNAITFTTLVNDSNLSFYFTSISVEENKMAIQANYYARYQATKYNTAVSGYGVRILLFNVPKPSGGISATTTTQAATTGAVSAVIATTSAGVAVAVSGTATSTSTGVSATGGEIKTVGTIQTATTGSPGTSTIFDKIRSFGLKIASKLPRFLRRKKKKEDEEEEYQKPSFTKTTLLLASIALVIGAIVGVIVGKAFTELLTVITSSIGLTLGTFGATIGTLILYVYKKGVIVVRKLLTKLALIVSALGGYYGIISSSFALISLLGILYLSLIHI